MWVAAWMVGASGRWGGQTTAYRWFFLHCSLLYVSAMYGSGEWIVAEGGKVRALGLTWCCPFLWWSTSTHHGSVVKSVKHQFQNGACRGCDASSSYGPQAHSCLSGRGCMIGVVFTKRVYQYRPLGCLFGSLVRQPRPALPRLVSWLGSSTIGLCCSMLPACAHLMIPAKWSVVAGDA